MINDKQEIKKKKQEPLTRYILMGRVGGKPTADCRIAVPFPLDGNTLRNPPRQHVPTDDYKIQIDNERMV